LTKAINQYPFDVLTALDNQGTLPDIVQTGNEISNGMLWPDGSINNLDNLASLLKSANSAVVKVSPSIKIMEHLALGGDNSASRAWIDAMISRGVKFDLIGESYYPQWQGTLKQLTDNLSDLSTRYTQEIIVVEYSQYKRQVNDIVYNLGGKKGLGTFIWEPTSWGEAFFYPNGSTIPDLINLYDKMYVDYHIKN